MDLEACRMLYGTHLMHRNRHKGPLLHVLLEVSS